MSDTPRRLRRELRLLRYARPHRLTIGLLFATMVADIALEVAQPWPLKIIVDNVLGHHPVPAALRGLLPGIGSPHALAAVAAVATVLIFALGAGSRSLYTYFSLQLGQRMVVALAGDIFAHLGRLSIGYHQRQPLGDRIARVTGDSYCVSTLVTDAVIPVVQALLTVAAMFVVMWSLEPLLTLVALSVLPVLGLVLRFAGSQIHERAREQRDSEAEMLVAVEQTLSAVSAVQAYTRERLEERRFRALARGTARAYLRATLAGIRFELLTGSVTAIGAAGTIYLGAELALRGKLTPGTIIVFLSYLRSLYDPLDSITHTGQTVLAARAEADRVLEVLEVEPEIVDTPGARPAQLHGTVAFEHVDFAYEPGRSVLHDISLTAKPGQTVAIVGPTGAGKTTLMSLLVRFYDPTAGQITVDGLALREIELEALRRQIALVPQDALIFPVSIADNIAYGRPEATREEVRAAARAAHADEFIARLPDGYDTRLEERGADLSGGERQRISIARAFLKDAPILILDEPTSALDLRTEELLLDAGERLAAGRITFVIAHRLSTVRRADEIIVLDGGEIVERGTHDQLLARDGLYADLHAAQFRSLTPAGADDA